MVRWAILLCLAVPHAAAQDFRAAISGTVSDKTGAVVAGARIRAVRNGANTAVETKTNHEGYYTLPFLNPGTYTFEVSAEGFKKLRETNIHLMVADKIDKPFVLELGNIATEITVIAEPELIQTGDASGGMNFDSNMVSEYALNGRQVYMLMALAPGVLFTQEQFGATGFSGTRGWDSNGSYVMNGGVQGTNQFLLNGAPISLTGSWQVSPNVEAVQEFKVMTNTYDARYGRTGGGTVNTTLKSGANQWHGSLFEYTRNNILDANVTQNNRVGAPRGKHITHQWGGTAGGRLRKDKDFLFTSFEGFRERVPFPVVKDTPLVDLRDGRNFSAYGVNVFDPLTTRPCVRGVDTAANTACFGAYIRDAFPGNALPQSRISPVGRKIASLWPAPNYAGETQNFIAAGNVGVYGYDQPMGKWDHIFASQDRLAVTFTYQHGNEFRNQNGFLPPIDTGNIHSQRTSQNYIASWNRVLSPTTIFDIRASFGRFTSYFPDGELETGLSPQDLGIKKLPYAPTAKANLAPRINLDQYTAIIGNLYTWNTSNQWSVSPTVTRVRGTHTTHFGGEFVYAGVGTGNIGRANGEFSFTRTWTQQYGDRGRNRFDGSGMADLLLGLPASGFIEYNDTFYRTWPYWAVFVQDDWKVSRKMTVNLGVRYDVQIPFLERHNRINNGFDLTAKNPLSDEVLANWRKLKADYDSRRPAIPYPDPPAALYGGKLFIGANDSRRPYNIDWTNLQPRIGLAWSILPKTVLRTGFGINHRTATQGNLTDGFSQRTNYFRSEEGSTTYLPRAGLTGPYSLEDPFPAGIVAPAGSRLGLLTNAGVGVSYDGRQRVIPRTFQYSFGLQRRLPWNSMIDASYVGSQTVHDTMAYQSDYIPIELLNQGRQTPTLLNRNLANPFFGILPVTSDFGASTTISALNLMRPYPLFNGITINTNPWSRYRYDSLQMRFERRFFGNRSKQGALTLVFSYTLAKSFEANHRLNDWNLGERPVHELSNYDKPQNIAFSGVWDLPFRRHKYFGGWNFNWIYTYNSGYPVPKPNAMFSCESYSVPVQTAERWFNNDVNCYRDRPAYSLRDTEDRFSNIRNPARPALNITLARTFRYRERYSLQLRGEAFNLTNTPQFSAPTTDFKNVRFGMLPLEQRNFPRLVQIAAKVLF